MTKVLINGGSVNEEDARASYKDRGYVFGDGICEYMRAYDGKLFTVKEHFERFLRSAEEIGLDLDYTTEELIELACRLLKESNVVNGGICVQATRGAAPRNHSFPTPPVKPVIMASTKSYDRPYEELE